MRMIAVLAALAAAMPGSLSAQAQELEGAPGYRAQQEAAKKAEAQKKASQPPTSQTQSRPAQTSQSQSAPDRLGADQAWLAQQAEAQKAEQARLDRQAANLKAQQARLDARAAELAAEEQRLAQLRADQDARAARLPELAQRDEPARDVRDEDVDDALPDISPAPRRPAYARLDVGAAQRSCARAAEDEALARRFYSARYDSAPRFYQNNGWELRGRIRLEDRRGYVFVDTVCEVDSNSEARDFIFLR